MIYPLCALELWRKSTAGGKVGHFSSSWETFDLIDTCRAKNTRAFSHPWRLA